MASRLGARRRKFDRLMAMIVVSDLPGDSRAGRLGRAGQVVGTRRVFPPEGEWWLS